MIAYRLPLLLALVGCWAPPAWAQGESWAGKKVMPKSAGLQIGYTDKDGKEIYVAKLTDFVYPVLQEEAGHVLLRHRGEVGWRLKTDLVPVQEAVVYFTTRIKTNPKDDYALAGRGVAKQNLGDVDGAIKDLTEAIQANPAAGVWLNDRGAAYVEKKDVAKARADFDAAIKLDPKDSLALMNRAGLYWSQNEFDKSIADYSSAIKLDPKDVEAYSGRAQAYERKKDYDHAIADHESARSLDPKDVSTINNLAWIFATCPKQELRNGKKAVELGLEAARLSDSKNPGVLDTLAAAYAEDGQFDLAIQTQKKALADTEFAKTSGEESRARLKLYEQKKPYREK
jgi:Flp pilus assembly protein TadD